MQQGLVGNWNVHHIEVINIKAGSAHASAAPPRIRRAARLVKSLHAACHTIRNQPHLHTSSPMIV